MITLDDFERLKREVEEDRKAAERAAGAATQLMKEIREAFDVKTLKEAEGLLVKLKRQRQRAAEAYSAAREKYDEERARRKGEQ